MLCPDVCEHGLVRLDSEVPVGLSGTVQLCVDGVWTGVCGEGWSALEASVVCRELGYSEYSKHIHTLAKLSLLLSLLFLLLLFANVVGVCLLFCCLLVVIVVKCWLLLCCFVVITIVSHRYTS